MHHLKLEECVFLVPCWSLLKVLPPWGLKTKNHERIAREVVFGLMRVWHMRWIFKHLDQKHYVPPCIWMPYILDITSNENCTTGHLPIPYRGGKGYWRRWGNRALQGEVQKIPPLPPNRWWHFGSNIFKDLTGLQIFPWGRKLKNTWKSCSSNQYTTVDGWNPANQLRLVVYPIISMVSYIPGGAGFQPSTVWIFLATIGWWMLVVDCLFGKDSSILKVWQGIRGGLRIIRKDITPENERMSQSEKGAFQKKRLLLQSFFLSTDFC